MANAFDFTDGLDGLSCGLLVICLLAFWAISISNLDHVTSVFIAVWIGSLFAFLYFNVYPARIMLGNMGGAEGQQKDILIAANEITRIKDQLNLILSKHTGQSVKKIETDTDRDFWMTAEESKKYGIVDKIIQ
jgi:hypothetical protein